MYMYMCLNWCCTYTIHCIYMYMYFTCILHVHVLYIHMYTMYMCIKYLQNYM